MTFQTPSAPPLSPLLPPGIYEFGNAGGLIAMAPHKLEGPTDVLYVSPDQGGCWHLVALPEAMTVENIRWVQAHHVRVGV